MNKPNSFIVLGGCHVNGHGIGTNPSFVRIAEETISLKCVFTKGLFQIKYIANISPICQKHQSSIILLQLGNFEFTASIKGLFSIKRHSYFSTLISASSLSNCNTPIPQMIIDKKNSLLHKSTSPLVWRILKLRYRRHLLLLRTIAINHPAINFVILSPFPCCKPPDNYIRQKASNFYGELFSGLPNVLNIDVFGFLPNDESFYFDSMHLNAGGHYLLGKEVGNRIIENIRC